MNSLFDHFEEKFGTWLTGKKSTQLMNVVTELLNTVKQQARSSDSPFRGLAKQCIDKAEDYYQEAIYNLKDGAPEVSFDYCRKGMNFLKLATMHLAAGVSEDKEPTFEEGTPEFAILHLARAIASLKSAVEYSNCKVGKAERERLVEVVHMYFDALDALRKERNELAKRTAQAGLLWMHFLGKSLEARTKAAIVPTLLFEKFGSARIERIADLANRIAEAYKLLADTSPEAQSRIKLYLKASIATYTRCVNAFLEEDGDCAQIARAGCMEVRMAQRLIESSTHEAFEHDADEEEIQMNSRIDNFKARIARVQRLLRENDPESEKILRRLYQVSAYYAKAQRLLKSLDFSEAERYARSAHLDIDYSRQLLDDKSARYSDLI